ncbi:bifunctional DNA primase/polymerase [Maioricimonas sp. JC845]|uniref:bifunctional DNA primase/polymerase n=1 Tax=Maioricimonas sp. JC845 TaxID=3232138 RepID=UPI00345B29E8
MSDAGRLTTIDAARDYIRRGWAPVPIPPGRKQPVVRGWPALRIAADDVPQHFAAEGNIGLILGSPSGGLVDVDLDCAEARELADEYLPPTPAITGRPSAPASHRWYIGRGVKTTKHQDPVDRSMLVELRSTGAQTVVGPSIHPSGEPYDRLTGEPAVVPGPMLAACVTALAEAVVKRRHPEGVPARCEQERPPPNRPLSPGADVHRRALAYLNRLPGAVSGQGGHNATYTAAVALVHGFGIEPEQALSLLLEHYNPRCEPPWTEKELAHKVHDAATKAHERPFGWLRDADRTSASHGTDVDLSGLMRRMAGSANVPSLPQVSTEDEDPGPTPAELLDVPGFVHEVMQYTLDNAPYPDQALAFAGALSLQALLAGRKVRDAADNRTNLYVVALANSGAGKNFPRITNDRILLHAGMAECLGDEIGSAEGMLDDLESTPSLLFQTDEIDFLMQSMTQPRESRYQRIMQSLLKLFTSANGLYVKRKKVGKQRGYIDQPCVCLYGTAIPETFYKSLSLKMLTNGWFARLLILETPRRGEGREDDETEDIPQSILETARWWSEFQPGRAGNLQEFHPEPIRVEASPDAKQRFRHFRKASDAEYRRGEQAGNQAQMAIWARSVEKARRLALIYACSENHVEPLITEAAADWACRLIAHQTRRMLFMAGLHVSDSDFEAKCKRVLEVLHEWRNQHGEEWMAYRDLSRKLRWSKRDHDEIRATLLDQELIDYDVQKTGGRCRQVYRLATIGPDF